MLSNCDQDCDLREISNSNQRFTIREKYIFFNAPTFTCAVPTKTVPKDLAICTSDILLCHVTDTVELPPGHGHCFYKPISSHYTYHSSPFPY